MIQIRNLDNTWSNLTEEFVSISRPDRSHVAIQLPGHKMLFHYSDVRSTDRNEARELKLKCAPTSTN